MAAKPKHKKIEFSKLLAIIVTTLFVFCILFSLIAWIKLDRIPAELLPYVAAPFATTVSGYLIKAGYENGRKHIQPPVVTPTQYSSCPDEKY